MLPAREALKIAADYGLPYRQFKDDIKLNLMEARKLDGVRGRSARRYFEIYTASVAHESMAESRAAACDEERRYGSS